MQYEQITQLSKQYIVNKIQDFLKEDVPRKDITTEATIPKKQRSKAYLISGNNLFGSLCNYII